jgi:hypothetical protein
VTLTLVFFAGLFVGVGLTLFIGYLADKAHPPDRFTDESIAELAERLYTMEHKHGQKD